MALHDPPIEVPFVDIETGFVTRPWADWLIINKRDKANRVEDATENNIAILTSSGHPADSASSLPTSDLVGIDDIQELANKTFAELVGTKILSSDGSGGVTEVDLDDWVSGSSGRITVTDDGDGTITLTIPLKTGFGIDYDTDGLKLKQSSNVTNAVTNHSITDPADSPASADALRDDLVANAIPEIKSALNALGTKINAALAVILYGEMMEAP